MMVKMRLISVKYQTFGLYKFEIICYNSSIILAGQVWRTMDSS